MRAWPKERRPPFWAVIGSYVISTLLAYSITPNGQLAAAVGVAGMVAVLVCWYIEQILKEVQRIRAVICPDDDGEPD